MSQQSKKLLLGRTSIVAISAIALLVVGGILAFARKAEAQRLTSRSIVTFPPSLMTPRDSRDGGTNNLLIGLLLPAVQRGATPLTIEAFTGDGSVRVPVPPPAAVGGGTAFFDVFVSSSTDANGRMLLHVVNQRTGLDPTPPRARPARGRRLLPAVQDVLLLPAVSVAETISGFNNASFADGSVEPIPFQYALPAVQLAAVQ